MKKHTVLIGGTRGLGRVLAKILISEGHTLSILARNKPNLEIADNQNPYYVEADLLEESSFLKGLDSIMDQKGKPSYLIFLQRYRGTADSWIGDLEVNLNATRKIINYLKEKFNLQENNDAAIVMVGSIAGTFAVDSQPLSYSIAKAGLNQMVRHYAAELGPRGIRVNAVSPITFLKEESQQFYKDNKKLYKLYQTMVPLKRMCTAEDVGNVISFLCSFRASFISGQNLIVDGGLSVLSHEMLARTLTE